MWFSLAFITSTIRSKLILQHHHVASSYFTPQEGEWTYIEHNVVNECFILPSYGRKIGFGAGDHPHQNSKLTPDNSFALCE